MNDDDLFAIEFAVDGRPLHKYEQRITGRKTCRRFVAGGMRAVRDLLPKRARILDFGGGRYDDSMEFMREWGHQLLVYDPYNRSPDHNLAVLASEWDAIICCNVLNILTDDVIHKALEDVVTLRRGTDMPVFFTVYEKDKDGIGKFSGADEFQRNERISSYVPRLELHFKTVVKIKGVLSCR